MAQQPSELLPEEKLKLQKPQWTPGDASELVQAQKFVQDSLIPRVKSINEPTMDDFRRIATEADKEMRGSDQIRLGQASLELTPLGLERKTNIVHATLYTIGIHQDIRHGVAIAKKVFESLDDTNPSGLASSASKDLPDILQLWLQTAALDMDTYMKSYNLALDEIEADHYKPEGVPSLEEFSWNTCLPRVWKAIINMVFNTDTLTERTEKENEGAAKNLAKVLQKLPAEEDEGLPAQGDEGLSTDPQGKINYLARNDLDNLIRRLKGDIEAMRYVWCVHDSPQIRPLNILVNELFKE
ncbi:hypothetical protein PGQ11_005708 [Apiospora arundinis]|uniref:Uncharacterized protein n=1 Tax=Apiospora arundinis TaxID=335852 RepID=A0ABR2JBL1_9PEZI